MKEILEGQLIIYIRSRAIATFSAITKALACHMRPPAVCCAGLTYVIVWGVPRRMDETGTRNGRRRWNPYSHGPAHVWNSNAQEDIKAATPDENYSQTIAIPLLGHLLME